MNTAFRLHNLWRVALWVALLVATATVFASTHGCAAGNRAVHVAVVGVGAGVQELQAHHGGAYTRGTDALIARLRAEHRSLADYDREVAPLDRAFAARGEAIRALASALYATAAINDAARAGGGEEIRRAVLRTLQALRMAVEVLTDGSILPALEMPPQVRSAMALLESLALSLSGPEPVRDGGVADGHD